MGVYNPEPAEGVRIRFAEREVTPGHAAIRGIVQESDVSVPLGDPESLSKQYG